MRKLSLSILAASVALVAAPAFAQGARPGPGPHPPAGHSWRGGGMTGMPAHGPNFQVRHFGNRGMHPGPNFRHRRMNRGFVIHPFWFGPQFHISNWQMYGFGNPGDGRWVRYYDDAYLIDRGGRVQDTRYGMDWDRYGEEWELEDGIPAYRGSRAYRPGEEDYEWAEGQGGHGERGGHSEHRGGHHGGQMMGGQGYGYGAAYGGYYGYGAYAYPIVIETITTSGAAMYEEIIEEVVEVRHRPRVRRHRPRCVCAPAARPAVRRPAPRPAPPRRPPPAGERG